MDIKPVKRRRSVHYVNNADFFDSIKAYHDTGRKGQVPKYIVECIQQICERLSRKPNFISYPFREDMVEEAIIDCIAAISNGKYDPERATRTGKPNPFSYITQIAKNSFLRVIVEEKKQYYIKHANMLNMFASTELESDPDFIQHIRSANTQITDSVIESFQTSLNNRKMKKTKKNENDELTGVENFTS